jgi:hypothetical protein
VLQQRTAEDLEVRPRPRGGSNGSNGSGNGAS